MFTLPKSKQRLLSVLIFLFICLTAVLSAVSETLKQTGTMLAVPNPFRILATQVFRDEAHATLGVASHIYVVSLSRRTDRRAKMEKLRTALGLRWQFVDALDKDDQRVDRVLAHVKAQRAQQNVSFVWPDISGSAPAPSVAVASDGSWPLLDLEDHRIAITTVKNDEPMVCATDDQTIPVYNISLTPVPFHRVLSRGMIACWYSHLSVIKEAAEGANRILSRSADWDSREGVTIVFEDDIDVEWDLRERLTAMWGDLPRDWDIVMLGHCWSDESARPPLHANSPLHPSTAPKCTHAYALSPRGAQRILAYLTYAPFAYSRALDQALAHLVNSGKLASFSVVPSVVVQAKSLGAGADDEEGASDIWVGAEGGAGSKWRDWLEDSALVRIGVV